MDNKNYRATDCPGCGNALRYDIPRKKLFCDYCSSEYEPEAFEGTLSAQESEVFGVTVFTCPNCGGEVFSTNRDITGTCSFCGTPVTFASRIADEKRPDYIIPFAKTKEDCKNIYLEMLKGNLFAPKELRDPELIDGFRGIYMPYLMEKVSHTGHIEGYVTKTKTKGDYDITDYYHVSGDMDCSYDQMLHDASSTFSDELSERVEPYLPGSEEAGMRKFYPAYLAGFYAEPADVGPEGYEMYFQELADGRTQDYLKVHILQGGSEIKDEVTKRYLQKRMERNMTLSSAGFSTAQIESDKKLKKQISRNAKIKSKEKEELMQLVRQEMREQKQEKEGKQEKKDGFVYEQKQEHRGMVMMPVWFLSYRNKDRVAYATVNGQTGRIAADIVIDLKKFFAVAAILSVLLFGLFSLVLMQPITVSVFAVWFAGIVLTVIKDEYAALFERTHSVKENQKRHFFGNDSAYAALLMPIALFAVAAIIVLICRFSFDFEVLRSDTAMKIYAALGFALSLVQMLGSFGKWKALDKNEKGIPWFFLSFLAAAAGALIVVVNPAADRFFYGAAAAVLLVQLIVLLQLVFSYNHLVTRPLPQFSHQGGDDRADK